MNYFAANSCKTCICSEVSLNKCLVSEQNSSTLKCQNKMTVWPDKRHNYFQWIHLPRADMQSGTWYFCPLLSASSCTALTASSSLTCCSDLQSEPHSQMPDSPHSLTQYVDFLQLAAVLLGVQEKGDLERREKAPPAPWCWDWGIDSGFACLLCTYVCACVCLCICAYICVCP